MKMKVAVRDNETGEVKVIETELYETRKDFREDLGRNGYTVIGGVEVDGEMSYASKRTEAAKRHRELV